MADGSIRVVTKLDNTALKQQIKEFEKELNGVQKEKAKTEALISKTNDKYKEEREVDAQFPAEFSHREDIDKRAAKELDPLIAKQEELNQKEQIYIQKIEAANAKLAEQAGIADASKQVDREVKAESAVANVKTQAEYNSLLEQTRAKMSAIESAAARVAQNTGLSKDKILEVNPAYQRLSDTMSVLQAKASDFGGRAKRAGKNAASGMRQAKREANGFSTAISKGIKKVGRMTLAVFGIRSAYRAVRMAMTEYMSTNERLAGTMETLKVGFAQLLGPAIESVVNLLVKAISVVNAFVHSLTGINFVAKMNSAALNKQAKATSSAAKASNQLAGFDEQTKLSDTSGGGGGGGAGVGALPDGLGMDLSFLDPIVEMFSKFATDMSPFISTVGDLLKWLYDEVFVPLGEWAATSLFPSVLGLISSAFGFLNEVLIAVQPMLLWLWENILQPIAEWTGGLIVDVINGIADGLGAVSTWISENQPLVEDIIIVIGSFAAAWGLVTLALNAWNIAVALWNSLGAIATAVTSAFGAAVAFLTSPVTLIILAIGALIAIVVLLVKHWDEVKEAAGRCWDWIKGVWNSVAEWFNQKIIQPVKNFFSGMWDGLKNGAKAAWEGVKSVFSGVASWFKNIFKNAWEGVKNVFSTGGKIFMGIVDGIANVFKTVVNAIISGINAVIAVPFNTINGMLNKIRSTSFLGVSPFKSLWKKDPLPVPQIPKLAKGGIVNNPGRGVHAIIGEAGKEAVLPLENNTEWMDILAEKISGGTVVIPIYLGGKKIAEYVVDLQKKKAFAMNGA